MEKKSKKDTDLDVLSTKLDCLNNRLNRMQNDYDSTLADLMISVREREAEKEAEKEADKEAHKHLVGLMEFLFKSTCVFAVVGISFCVLGEVVKSVIHCFM